MHFHNMINEIGIKWEQLVVGSLGNCLQLSDSCDSPWIVVEREIWSRLRGRWPGAVGCNLGWFSTPTQASTQDARGARAADRGTHLTALCILYILVHPGSCPNLHP